MMTQTLNNCNTLITAACSAADPGLSILICGCLPSRNFSTCTLHPVKVVSTGQNAAIVLVTTSTVKQENCAAPLCYQLCQKPTLSSKETLSLPQSSGATGAIEDSSLLSKSVQPNFDLVIDSCSSAHCEYCISHCFILVS
jgi:hypothetical protein